MMPNFDLWTCFGENSPANTLIPSQPYIIRSTQLHCGLEKNMKNVQGRRVIFLRVTRVVGQTYRKVKGEDNLG